MNKETNLRIHNITAKAAFKFGSEAWVLKKREEQRLEAAQMKFLRHLLGITNLDKGKNQCFRKKTGAENIVKEIKPYQEKWLEHIQRMDTNRILKKALQYKPKARGHVGRPRKRWRVQFHFEDTRNRNQT
jgi:predicted GTPase